MLQFPPAFHIRAAETGCNTQPGPHLVQRARERHTHGPCPHLIAPYEDASAIKHNQKIQTATN